MSKRYWGIVAAFAGIAALTVATGVGAFFGSVYAPEKRHYQSVGSNSGQAYPSDSPRNGLADVSGIDSLAESIVAKPQPRNTEEREQRDLAAQESMAVFAYWMVWAMFFQTALAGGALFALLKDLQQNRSSADAQLRAYVGIESVKVCSKMRIVLLVKNFGQTPATNVVMTTRHEINGSGVWQDLTHGFGMIDPGHPVPGEISNINSEILIPNGVKQIRVNLEIEYSDQMGGRWRRKAEFYSPIVRGDWPWEMAVLPNTSSEERVA